MAGTGTHLQFQRSAVDEVVVVEPGLVPSLTVEAGRLDVFVLARGSLCLYGEDLTVVQPHADLLEQGTADGVNGKTGGDGVESHG